MKYKCFVFVAIVFVFIGSGISDYRSQNLTHYSEFELSISSSKAAYISGETVEINIRFENNGIDRVLMHGSPHPENAHITFYVSRDGVNYVRHLNPEWGKRKIGNPMWLPPNESSEGTGYLIWNLKPNVQGMNTRAAARWQRGKLLTDYTFQYAGTYFVKATLGGVRLPGNRGVPVIESEPIEITIEEPEGDDLEVWTQIQNREEIAYFMQEGLIKNVGGDRGRRRRILNDLRTIVNQYPDSIIAAQIRQKLQEYRERYPSERFSN